MDTIPGSAHELTTSESVTKSDCGVTLSDPIAPSEGAYYLEPRWAKFGGKKPPMTPARIGAIAEKRYWEKHGPRTDADRARYASGRELAAAIANGALVPFEFPERVLLTAFPRAGLIRKRQLQLIGLIAAVVFAPPPWARVGVIASQDELGMLVGLRERRMRLLVRQLIGWGLLVDQPTFTGFGVVHNRRANAYTLAPTLHAALASWDRARARVPGSRDSRSGVPGNPEIPVSYSGLDKALSGDCPALDHQGSPGKPATRLPSGSASCSWPETREAETRTAAEKAPRGGDASIALRSAVAAAAIEPHVAQALLAVLPDASESDGARSVLHCWKPGPETDDGMSTTCMLPSGHLEPHDWTRDDRIGVAFAGGAS